MANNIKAGLNFVVSNTTDTWANVGIITANTIEVYTTDSSGNPLSYRPDHVINTLTDTGVNAGQGYQLNSKIVREMDCFKERTVLDFSTDEFPSLPDAVQAITLNADEYAALGTKDENTLYIIPKPGL